MSSGGMNPCPRRMGGPGPNGNRLQNIYTALGRARGDAYDTTQQSNVSAETMATARLLSSIWASNQRLANQWDPARMTTNLPRWEKILNIVPGPNDSDVTRRNRIAAIFARTGQAPFTSYLTTQLSALLGSVFVAVEYISYTNAVISVPDGTYPWGTPSTIAPWSSTTGHILIRVQQPAGYKESDFQAAIGLIPPFMEAVAPAWVTYDWYRPGPVFTNVVGGPSAGGFYLDDAHNLDNEVFDDLLSTPLVIAVVPSLGDTAGGGQAVVIQVDSSAGATGATLGGVALTSFAIVDATHVSGIPGAHALGAVNVQVTNAAGPGTLTNGFEYWTPAQATSVDIYLDANKGWVPGATATWTDQSANARSFTQATAGNQPVQTATVFGTLPSIRFTPQQFVRLGTNVVLASGLSVFWVAKYTSARTTITQAAFGAVSQSVLGDQTNGWVSAGCAAGQVAYTGDGSGTQILKGAGLNDGSARLLGVTHATGGAVQAFSGGTQIGTNGASAYDTVHTGYTTIGDGFANTDGWNGDIGAVIIISGIISGPDLTKLNSWSQQRWGTP